MPVAERGRGGRPSRYDVAKCRAWRTAHQDHGVADAPGGLFKERARRELAQALLVEQTYAVRAKTLLPAEEVERVWSAEQTAVRAMLLALPQAYADRLCRAATQDGVAGAEHAIRQMVDEVLTELAVRPTRKSRRRPKAC